MSMLRRLPPLAAISLLAAACSQNVPATGSMRASSSAFQGGSEANLTFVRPDREGPMVRVSPDDSPGGRGWLVSLAVRNFGHEKSMPGVEIQVHVDGRLAADWVVSGPIREDETVANRSLSIGELSPGEHEIRVVIDPSGQIPETMKSDNEFRTTFTVKPKG